MSAVKSALLAAAFGLLFAHAVPAQEGEAEPAPPKQSWSFSGPFGTFDEHQVQRGFQVFREVCSGCHAARLLAFRNLSEEGGPGFSEGQVKQLAAEYEVADPSVEGGTRTATAADHWPPSMSEADAAAAFGAVPPDLSVIAKARGIADPFPWWLVNYFTAYQEGGADYIHGLLTGYEEEPPEGFELPDGKYYNRYFPGHAIGMPPPLSEEGVAYEAAEGEAAVPQTVEQYSEDVSAFLMWLADPHMVARKESGFRVILFLLLLAGLMWAVKRRVWTGIEH